MSSDGSAREQICPRTPRPVITTSHALRVTTFPHLTCPLMSPCMHSRYWGLRSKTNATTLYYALTRRAYIIVIC